MNENTQKIDVVTIKMKKILNSVWMIFVLAGIVALGWTFKLTYISLPILLIYEGLVLYFCREDIKAFFFPMIAIWYAIAGIHTDIAVWIFYVVLFVIYVGLIVTYIVREKVKFKRVFKRGQMFWAFVLAGIGNMLAGIIGFFDIKIFLVVTCFCFLVYFFYWMFINFFTLESKKYLAYALIGLTTIICIEMIVAYVRFGDFFTAISYKAIRVGTGEINAAAIFMLSGVCSCFYLARGNKYDYLYMLLGLIFDIFVYLTYSRIALAICVFATIIYFIVNFKDSPNKKIILIALATIFALFLIFVVVFWEKFVLILKFYLNMGFSKNGREYLWKWNWYQFEDNKIFGIGFVTREYDAVHNLIPGMEDNFGIGIAITNPHNVFLHYLTATGLVGTVLNMYLYFKKYKMVFTKFNDFKFYALMVYFCNFIASCFDPTPTNNFFHVMISLLFYALVEIEDEGKEPWEVAFQDRKQAKLIVNKFSANKNNKNKKSKTQEQKNVNVIKDEKNISKVSTKYSTQSIKDYYKKAKKDTNT